MNYLILVLVTLVVTFLAHPSSLLVVALLLAGWGYVFIIRTSPLVIGGRTLSDREKLLGMAATSFITVFFLTNVGAVLFSAISISLALIAAHGATRVPDDLFLEEQDTSATGGGLLGGLLGGGSGTVTGTPVASKV